jgi:predicted acetyltransferase
MLYTGFQDLKKYYEDKQITDTYFLILEGLENHINLLQNKNEKVPPSIDYKKSESFVKRHNIKVIKDPNDWQSDETSVKKIDVNRIKEIRDNDLKANKDFKEIDIKSGLSNAENAVYLRHHK